MFSHAARHVDAAVGAPGLIAGFKAGHSGVDLFFVLSGFIIFYVHRRDVGRPRQLARYAARRFKRIAPLYWVALAITVLMAGAGSRGWPGASWVVWSAALLPSWQEPVLGIAWTLQFEVVFYAIFAVLILNARAGVVVLALWLAGVGASALIALHGAAGSDGASALPPQFASPFCLLFFFGIAAAGLVRSGRIAAPRRLAAAGAALFGLSYACECVGLLDGFGAAARLAYGLAAAGLIAGIATLDQARPLALPAWLQALGAASYSIYLFQFVFIGVAWQVLTRLHLETAAPGWASFGVLSAAGVIGGVVVSKLVERPLLRAMRSRTVPRTA